MIGFTLGNIGIGGVQCCGMAINVTAKQVADKLVAIAWDAEGVPDAASIVFAVYLDGKLQQRLPGNVRVTTLIAPDTNIHDIRVEAWPSNFTPPDDAYGATATMRAHLYWTRPNDPGIHEYRIYKSETEGGTYTLYDTIDEPVIITEYKPIGSGFIQISGTAANTDFTNSVLTVEVTNDDTGIAELTNDLNADIIPFTYARGLPAVPIEGITIVITGSPEIGDSTTFLAALPTFYDSGILAEGTHWFKVSSVDGAGNESSLGTAIGIVITPPPAPVQAFDISYDENSDFITYEVTQSATASADTVHIYSNYDTSTGQLMATPIFDAPLATVSLATGLSDSGDLLDASGLPAGTYQFVARAVSSAGIDDQTSHVESIVIPFVPEELPIISSLTAEPTAGGDVRVVWLADKIAPNGWSIAGLSTDPLVITPTPSASEDQFQYTADIDAADIGPDDTYTATLRARTAGGSATGQPASVEFTTDSVAPSAPTGLMGIPF